MVRLFRRPAFWLLLLIAAALVAATEHWSHTRRQAEQVNAAHVNVASVPAGAHIKVDGADEGSTPAVLAVAPGPHTIALNRAGYGNAVYSVAPGSASTSELQSRMWRSAPDVVPLLPALPGTKITNAQPLGDGQIAVTIEFPSGLHQIWLADADGRPQRSTDAQPSKQAALSMDGSQLASARASTQAAGLGVRADEIWVANISDSGPGRRLYGVPPNGPNSALVDVGWTPDGNHLLAVVSTGSATGATTSILLLDVTSGQSQALAALPSQVVPGSYRWAPDHGSVAFLTRTDQGLSLCLLRLSDGQLQYLSDVAGQATDPIPFAPIAWSPDGTQMVYQAYDRRHPATSWFFGSTPQAVIVRANSDGSGAHNLGALQLHYPVWYPDGSVAAWAPPGSGKPISLKSVSRPGDVLATLPLSNAEFGVRWDAAHDQALIAVRRSSGSAPLDFSLVRFVGDDQ